MNSNLEVKKIVNYIKKKITPEIIALILIFIIGSVVLFLHPIIGIADNGDFYRIISQNGLYHLPKNDVDIMFGYFNRQYGVYRFANETTATLFSTQSIFIKLAVMLSSIFNKNYIFDIRFQSIIFLVLHSISAYLLVKAFTKDIKQQSVKYFIAILYVVIFCDTAYIAYFNSFYGEGVIIPCFLLSVAILLYMIKFNKINLANIIMFSVFSILFFGAKQQLSPIGILASILVIRLGFANNKKYIKIASILIGIAFIVASVFLYKSITGDFDYMNRFHAITRGILMQEDNEEDVLKDFGIDGSYSLLRGENFYNTIPSINPNDERLKEEFYENYSTVSVLIYYLKNPNEFLSILEMGMKNAYTIKPEAMGNYEKIEGKPYGAKSYFFSTWSYLKDNSLFRSFTFSIFFIIIYFFMSLRLYKKSLDNNNLEGCLFEEAFMYIFLAGFSQIIISVVGAGDADIAKHEFLYNMTFDLMIINLVVKYFIWLEGKKVGK